MSRVARSATSRRDAKVIWTYIAWDDPAAADALIERIDARIHVLADHPLTGSDRADVSPGLRSVGVGNYTLFYRPISDGIRVVRIVHASRDLSKVFRRR